jgi:hypothetical protein
VSEEPKHITLVSEVVTCHDCTRTPPFYEKMEMAEMMELLLARLDGNTKTNQEMLAKMKADREQRKAERETNKEKRDAIHEDMKAGKEKHEQVLARMEAQQEEREADRTNTGQNGRKNDRDPSQDRREA